MFFSPARLPPARHASRWPHPHPPGSSPDYVPTGPVDVPTETSSRPVHGQPHVRRPVRNVRWNGLLHPSVFPSQSAEPPGATATPVDLRKLS